MNPITKTAKQVGEELSETAASAADAARNLGSKLADGAKDLADATRDAAGKAYDAVREGADKVAKRVHSGGESLYDDAATAASDASAAVKRGYNSACSNSDECLNSATRWISANPLKAVGIALAGGLLLAFSRRNS